MKGIQKLRSKLFKSALKKELQYKRFTRKSLSLEEAHSVGILFDATNPEMRQTVLNFARRLKNQDKKVRLLGYIHTNQKEDNPSFPHFKKKEVDFSFRPKTETAKEFLSRNFDLLINLSPKNLPWLDYLAALSPAKFRVGQVSENTAAYDLMIETRQPGNLEHFIRQMEYFLNKMATHYEPVPA